MNNITVAVGGLRLEDPGKRLWSYAGYTDRVGPFAHRLLTTLSSRPDELVTWRQLGWAVWGLTDSDPWPDIQGLIPRMMMHLRAKLRIPVGELIVSVRNLGLRMLDWPVRCGLANLPERLIPALPKEPEAEPEGLKDRVRRTLDLCIGKLSLIDWFHRTWLYDGRPVKLTPHEHLLLFLLVINAGSEVKVEKLGWLAWRDEVVNTVTVRTHIGRLRRKLGAGDELIQTVWHSHSYIIPVLQSARAVRLQNHGPGRAPIHRLLSHLKP